MFGYDAPRLHAALNDLPAALLLVAVVFDLLGAVLKRDSLKAAGFWTLVLGVLGTGGAIVSGLMAEDATPHGADAHAAMETHETLAFIVLTIFGILAAWRLLRRGVWSDKEQPVALTAGVIGVALLVVTGMVGGKLVFEHGVGIPTATLQSAIVERAAGGGEQEGEARPAAAAPAAAAPRDSAAPIAAPDSTKREDDDR